ncbi:MAG TPA: L-histidine N(alpha)-methyltransferase [Dehalococcoidia bacterium]|nr:L-histidine N(alpha)-methyltransferase [Dehalococcoidia bacterium]
MADIRIDNYLNNHDFFSNMAEDVRRGLTATPKRLQPKYLYDERGSDLFEQITELPEYYPMREEGSLLNLISPGLIASMAPGEIVELGSGSSTKTRALLDAGRANGCLRRYVAFDVSESIVRLAIAELLQRYNGLDVYGIVGDFHRHLDKIPGHTGRRLVLFLGGTLGNLYREERIDLLRQIGALLAPDDRLLVGFDLVKDIPLIEAAYNDAQGVTADFNRNMLNVINNGLDGDFDPEAFEHYAYFNTQESRIEMHLRPKSKQVAHLKKLGLTVEIEPPETLWTESSHKFTPDSVREMLTASGLSLREWYAAPKDMFALALAGPA